MKRVRVSAAGLLTLVLGLALGTSPASGDPATFSPSSSPFGAKFDEWSARWWQYVESFPTSENPLLDSSGVRCAIGQSGPVWFLVGSRGGGPVTRSCAVPEGTALLFPVLNIVDVNTDHQTADELRAEVAPLIDAATDLAVSVDGDPVSKFEKSPEKYRIFSTVFSVTLPADNFFRIAAGTYSPAIGDGFYVMLKPLGVGSHTLRFRGSIPIISFSVDVTYRLDIVPTRLE